MGKTVSIIAALALITVSLSAGETSISSKLGCSFVAPAGWTVDTALSDQINIYYDRHPSATVSIRRYFIERANYIKSDDDLAEAISGLYSDLGIDSIGPEPAEFYVEGTRAIFNREFTTRDPVNKILYQKHLKGTVIRLSDGRQVLYLILAKAPAELDRIVLADFQSIISSFHIVEDLSQTLYPRRNLSPFLLIFLILLLTAFFFARNRRVQRSRNPLGRDSGNIWRCDSCGLANHVDSHNCSRCGRERVEIKTIRS